MSNDARKPWEHAKGGGEAGIETDPLATRFVSSLDHDWRLYQHDIRGSIAHARMLRHVGLITVDELAEIERGLKEIEAEIDALGPNGRQWPGFKVELEDVHMCVEAALIEKVGEPGRKLHTGRSRNDQVALDLLLWTCEARNEVARRVGEVIGSLVNLAERQGRMVMPSYTHLQRAQPVLVGGELLAWAEAMNQQVERLTVLQPPPRSPLGSGAVAGSSLPLDRQAVAKELFEEDVPEDFLDSLADVLGVSEEELAEAGPEMLLTRNAIHATASRDDALDLVYALSVIAMWLSRWAEQWILYASTEFGFITLDDRYTTGSSMMPQKQNPDMLELVRGKCGGVYGNLVALLTILKGLPIGYNRDLQEDKKHVFEAYDTVCDCLDMAAHIVATTTFNEEKIEAGLDRGYLDATSLAEYLVTRGVAFRTAHQIVGALVRKCENTGRFKLEQLTLDEINEAVTAARGERPGEQAVDKDVYDWLGPANVVKRYQTAGNAGLTGFEEQLKQWKQRLSGADE
ncbi:MAG: argininosuccinate lyase [Phycisphaeraceae bacterium]